VLLSKRVERVQLKAKTTTTTRTTTRTTSAGNYM